MTFVKANPSTAEKILLFLIYLILTIGIVAAWVNKEWFLQRYVVEDGFVENITLLPLAVMIIASVFYLFKYGRRKNCWFLLTYISTATFALFMLGEEASWGQRVFNFKTTEYFAEHNSQDEMNIHNLVIDGNRLNKIIFTNALISGVVIYLIILPVLYKQKPKIKRFFDQAAFPIPKLYQIILSVLVFPLSFLSFDPKSAELLEFGAAGMFMLIFLYPQNHNSRASGVI